jgi:beta-D-galactosyl-(1->4)-L-rhamnose phosphorylase
MSEQSVSGNFTLPGEAGYESLTLELARRWGADVIRDSDGTTLSCEILDAGYGIYSTICAIREHNDWIKEHLHTRQQTFLCTAPKTAIEKTLIISLMSGFFDQQFQINDSAEAMKYWQVFDRTTNTPVSQDKWYYDAESGTVIVDTNPWRQYTVSFLAWRVWEEISMYNHTTNNWDKEHLMQLNPYDPQAHSYLKQYMVKWCADRPQTTVVRFTSLFYNFVWIWGSDIRNRHLFTDWASYDFTVCPASLDDFEKEYGYALTAEDFVRQGKYNATHRLPSAKKHDWMKFISKFVRNASRELIDIVHAAGKKAYVFYDDCWIGMEPYNGHFEEFGFDGIIKCVFSGYEIRLCANVQAPVHEIRFHPYLFPVGLGGAPTFSTGGRPGDDARNYWISARRALLRQKIERCGLGGYLHLVKDYPDFIDAMDNILEEFRKIGSFHDAGKPYVLKPKIAILHAWGALRTWTLSGHFHETDRFILIHILESLSGLPFDIKFISFDYIKNVGLAGIDVVISAGEAGDAWSGGDCWKDSDIVESLTEWVHNGGIFLSFGEPSAVEGYNTFLRMAHVLGIDIDKGEHSCHGRWAFDVSRVEGLIPQGAEILSREGVILTDGTARVLDAVYNVPAITIKEFGKGKGVYCANFSVTQPNTRLLQNLIVYASTGILEDEGLTDDLYTECAIYPDAGKLVFTNNSAEPRAAACVWKNKRYCTEVEPKKMKVLDL